MSQPLSDFTLAAHTFIVSDIHVQDAEPPHPKNPLWKRFKRPKFFVDATFKKFLEFIQAEAISGGPIELILNGDILDFDSVMRIPEKPEFHVSWLERRRGLAAEEAKSRFKLKTVFEDHPVWVESLKQFVAAGHRIVFVIGNHDIEFYWPSVQQDIHAALGDPDKKSVRFVEWFYISNKDTLVEHGNHYDVYSVCTNPVNPLIKVGKHSIVRLPFGNLAGRYMMNGMGLMNPQSDSTFIRESLAEYMVFYYRYVMRTQPLIMWTWFWSALVTLVVTTTEGLHRALSDPLTIVDRVENMAERANGAPRMVWALRELHAHPAAFHPMQTLRELWLDRAILLGLVLFVSFQVFSFTNVFVRVSLWWFLIPLLLLLPVFIFYARSVRTDTKEIQKQGFLATPIAAKIAGVKRVVHGHTHIAKHAPSEGIEYLNTGTWSPSFHDVECTQPYVRKCFAWIKPGPDGGERVAELYEWNGTGAELFPRTDGW